MENEDYKNLKPGKVYEITDSDKKVLILDRLPSVDSGFWAWKVHVREENSKILFIRDIRRLKNF